MTTPVGYDFDRRTVNGPSLQMQTMAALTPDTTANDAIRILSGISRQQDLPSTFQVTGRRLNNPPRSASRKKGSISGDLNLLHDQERVWQQTPLGKYYNNVTIQSPEPRFADHITVRSEPLIRGTRSTTPGGKSRSLTLPPLSIYSQRGSVIGEDITCSDLEGFSSLDHDDVSRINEQRRVQHHHRRRRASRIRSRNSTMVSAPVTSLDTVGQQSSSAASFYVPGRPFTPLNQCLNVRKSYDPSGRLLASGYPTVPNNSKENISRGRYNFNSVDSYLKYNGDSKYKILPKIDVLSGRSFATPLATSTSPPPASKSPTKAPQRCGNVVYLGGATSPTKATSGNLAGFRLSNGSNLSSTLQVKPPGIDWKREKCVPKATPSLTMMAIHEVDNVHE